MPPRKRNPETLQIAIYRIKTSEVDRAKTDILLSGFKSQELILPEVDGFAPELYYQQEPATPRWKGFFSRLAKSDQEILQPNKSRVEGFILILRHKTNGNAYAATGGPGHFAIQSHIDPNFGMDVLSRLLKKEDRVLKTAREKGVVGTVLGSTRHFRRSSTLHEIDSFGKIYQELKAKLRKDELIAKMGLDQNILKKDSVCIAKSSFRLNKAISIEELVKVIKGCETILSTEQPIPINSVERVIRKKNAALVQELESELLAQLWKKYSNAQGAFSFDLCAEEFEDYLTASRYVVRKGHSSKDLFEFEEFQNIDTFFDRLRGSRENPQTQQDFIGLMRAIRILSFDENDTLRTEGTLFDHLMGDVACNGARYFLLDRSWFRIKDAFITDLNARCRALISRNFYAGIGERWNATQESENQFNARHIGKPNTIVLDKVTPENIEPCDILQWDDERAYLIHVKAGFGNTMRDLCSQINIAAHRLNEDVLGSKGYLRKIYAELRNKIGGDSYFDSIGKQTNKYSETEFLKLFDKKLVFVLAVLDTNLTADRDIREPASFGSNIAKFSLHELSKSIRGLDVEFRVAQILRP